VIGVFQTLSAGKAGHFVPGSVTAWSTLPVLDASDAALARDPGEASANAFPAVDATIPAQTNDSAAVTILLR
jgi:hypothetical protein